jgi:hypothetical protein
MANDACTKLVRRTLETEREIWTIYRVILASARAYFNNEAHYIDLARLEGNVDVKTRPWHRAWWVNGGGNDKRSA